MRVVFKNESFSIIDDFFPLDKQALVWAYVQEEEFRHIRDPRWDKAFRLTDGNPLRGPAYLSHQYAGDDKRPFFPTGKGIDLVFDAILKNIDSFTPWVGQQGVDWEFFFARAYLYQAMEGLSWHRDNNYNAAGAFVYYAHPQWDVQWGGELLIASHISKDIVYPKKETYEGDKKHLGSHLDNSFENEILMEMGLGHYILPKPNRLVLLQSGILHTIKKVDRAAGDHVRAIIQGFFLHPSKNKD